MIGKTNAILGGAIEKPKITVTRIDQTITDPFYMITRVVDGGGIEAIRANSHRYTGTFSNGVMRLKQLDDRKGNRYTDGTDAETSLPYQDVWMRLPEFHWKCVQYATDEWDFYVAYGDRPDSSYNTWDGKDLIGVYKAVDNNGTLHSISMLKNSAEISQSDYKLLARERGNGFTLIKWKHHCMMAMLYYAMYKNTDCGATIGGGNKDNGQMYNGGTNRLGMTDTAVVSDTNYDVNFWGLESWWGTCYEYIDNVTIENGSWVITEDDGTERVAGVSVSSNGYISKMMFGENIDLIPSKVDASIATGFCDMYYYPTAEIRVVRRCGFGYPGGIAFIYANASKTSTSENVGTRLAFRGEIVIE